MEWYEAMQLKGFGYGTRVDERAASDPDSIASEQFGQAFLHAYESLVSDSRDYGRIPTEKEVRDRMAMRVEASVGDALRICPRLKIEHPEVFSYGFVTQEQFDMMSEVAERARRFFCEREAQAEAYFSARRGLVSRRVRMSVSMHDCSVKAVVEGADIRMFLNHGLSSLSEIVFVGAEVTQGEVPEKFGGLYNEIDRKDGRYEIGFLVGTGMREYAEFTIECDDVIATDRHGRRIDDDYDILLVPLVDHLLQDLDGKRWGRDEADRTYRRSGRSGVRHLPRSLARIVGVRAGAQADLVLNGPDGAMSIAAEPGYVLDPSTYDGFFVENGRLVFDESKIVDGSLTLAAESVPERYKLTLDGATAEVEYGSLVTRDVASDILWFEDSDGTVHGEIDGGVWGYSYDRLGDLDLKSVKGSKVSVEPGKVVKSTSDSFFFTISDSGQSAAVSTPSGLTFVIDPHMEAGERIAVSVSKTGYDGYRAYDIKSDGRVHVLFPVEDEDTTLFHVVNGIPVEMAGHYVIGDEGEMYLDTHLSSYSVYYLSEKASEKGSTSYLPLICLTVVAAAVAIAAIAYMLKRSREARGS